MDKEITGTIALSVAEYYKTSDILLANLTTQSNGKLLETGGMLYVKAKKGEKTLKLKSNTSVEIAFPKKGKKQSMKLFSGAWKDDTINWVLQNNDYDSEIIDTNHIESDPEEIQVPLNVIETVPVYPGCENLDRTQSIKCLSDAIKKFINQKFNTEIIETFGLSGKYKITSTFKINQNGDIVSIKSRSIHPELEQEANRVIALLPKMKPGIQGGKAVSVPYSLPITFQTEGSWSKDKLLTKQKLEKKISDKDSDLKTSDITNYILRSSRLGWINCDRFLNRSSIRYKVNVKNSEGTRINMVFKSISSVIPSRKGDKIFDFNMVPNNEKIALIAIKKDGDRLYFDIVETTTKENPNIEFNFKAVSLAELKKQLKKLDD